MVQRLHIVTAQRGSGQIITKRGQTLGSVEDPMGNLPRQVNDSVRYQRGTTDAKWKANKAHQRQERTSLHSVVKQRGQPEA